MTAVPVGPNNDKERFHDLIIEENIKTTEKNQFKMEQGGPKTASPMTTSPLKGSTGKQSSLGDINGPSGSEGEIKKLVLENTENFMASNNYHYKVKGIGEMCDSYDKLIEMLWLYEQTREKIKPFCGEYEMLSHFTFMQKVKQIISIFKQQINSCTNK
jgi:hypothetical protein